MVPSLANKRKKSAVPAASALASCQVPVLALLPEAAAVIHSDLARGFIKAETIAWDEFVRVGGWARAREGGNVRQEGKEYLVADGDVILFKFNV